MAKQKSTIPVLATAEEIRNLMNSGTKFLFDDSKIGAAIIAKVKLGDYTFEIHNDAKKKPLGIEVLAKIVEGEIQWDPARFVHRTRGGKHLVFAIPVKDSESLYKTNIYVRYSDKNKKRAKNIDSIEDLDV